MSPSRAPGRTAATARRCASSVAHSSVRAGSAISPTATVAALSPWKPPTISATSTPTMSPARSTALRSGMPWQITSLIEVHTLRGKPL
jgi:hypothetical protein